MAAEMLKDGKEAVRIKIQGEESTQRTHHPMYHGKKEGGRMRGEKPGEACQRECNKKETWSYDHQQQL